MELSLTHFSRRGSSVEQLHQIICIEATIAHSHTISRVVGKLGTDYHLLIGLYDANDLIHYVGRNFGSKLVIAY